MSQDPSPQGTFRPHTSHFPQPHASLSAWCCQQPLVDALTHAWPYVSDAIIRYSTICKALLPPSYLHLPIIARITRTNLQYSLYHLNEHCILPRICSIIHCTIFIFAFAMDYAPPWISNSCSNQAFFVSEIVSIRTRSCASVPPTSAHCCCFIDSCFHNRT